MCTVFRLKLTWAFFKFALKFFRCNSYDNNTEYISSFSPITLSFPLSFNCSYSEGKFFTLLYNYKLVINLC